MRTNRKELQDTADFFQAAGDAALKLVKNLKPDAPAEEKAANEVNRLQARRHHLAETALRKQAQFLP